MTLAPGSISPTSPAIDNGQSVNLTANPSGGSGGYTFAWHQNSTETGPCASGAPAGGNVNPLPTGPLSAGSGPYYYCYVVTDGTLASGNSSWDQVVVNPSLVAGAPSPSGLKLDAGQSTNLLAAASGGTPSLTYVWHWSTSSAGSCAASSTLGTGSTQSTASVATTPGVYYFCYVVTDSSVGTTGPSSKNSTWDLVSVNSSLTAPSTPSVSATALDVDQSLTVSGVLPSTGTAPYKWQWLFSVNGGTPKANPPCAVSSGTGATAGTQETCAIAAGLLTAGDSYTFLLRVNDSATTPKSQTSGASAAVAVSSALVVGPVSPSGEVLDAGQSVLLTASPSGGTAPYTYQWYSSATGTGACSSGTVGATGANESVTPTANRYYCYAVSDSASAPSTGSSAWTLVTVNPALTAPSAPAVNATALDSDQPLLVTGTIPSSGTATYSWQWRLSTNAGAYVLASVCSVKSGSGAAAGATVTCSVPAGSLTAGSSYAFELRVTDNATTSETRTSAASSTVVVSTPLGTPAAPLPSATTLDADQALYVNATLPSTGTQPYAWQWLASVGGAPFSSATECGASASGSGGTGGSSITCTVPGGTLAASTSYAFEIEVSDHATTVETRSSAPSAIVSTSSALTAGAPSPMTANLDQGQSVTLAANPSGGAGGYAIRWYSGTSAVGCVALGSPIPGATTATWVASPTATTYFCYTVTDAASNQATSRASEAVVNPALTAPAAPLPSAASWADGTTLNVTATLPSTGTPTYSWQWLVSFNGSAFVDASLCAMNSGQGAPSGAQVVCSVPSSERGAGTTYAFALKVTDSASTPEAATSQPSAQVLTSAPLSAGPPTPLSPTIDLGQSIVLAAQASGGSGAYAYQWYSANTSAGCLAGTSPLAGATSSTYSASPTNSTYYCYGVSDVGTGANASGPIMGGASLVTVDSALVSSTAPTTSGTSLSAGEVLTISATIPATGTAPYAWTWLVSLNGGPWVPASGCGTSTNGTGAIAGSTETCQMAAAQLAGGGHYSFALEVTDSSAVPSTVISPPTAAVTVGATGSGGSAGAFPTTLVAIGVAVAIAAVLLLLLLLGRRRHPRPRSHPRSHPAPLTTWEEGPPPSSPPGRGHPEGSVRPIPEALRPSAAVAATTPSPAPEPVVAKAEAAPTPPARPPVSELNDLDSVLGELDRIRDDMTRRPHRKDGEQPDADRSSSETRDG